MERQQININSQRQTLINQLLEELDRKTKALQSVGREVATLRQNAEEQQSTIKSLEEQLNNSDLRTSKLIMAYDLDIIPHPELKRRYGLLAGKLEAAMGCLSKNQSRLYELEGLETDYGHIEREADEMRHAHAAQQELVLDLQGSLRKYQFVIKQQESLIIKLERNVPAIDSDSGSSLAQYSVSD